MVAIVSSLFSVQHESARWNFRPLNQLNAWDWISPREFSSELRLVRDRICADFFSVKGNVLECINKNGAQSYYSTETFCSVIIREHLCYLALFCHPFHKTVMTPCILTARFAEQINTKHFSKFLIYTILKFYGLFCEVDLRAISFDDHCSTS